MTQPYSLTHTADTTHAKASAAKRLRSPKKTRHLPSILSPEEVAHLIDSSQTQFHRMVLMTVYATGVRRSELSRLQIPDIDSRRMVIHIRGGNLLTSLALPGAFFISISASPRAASFKQLYRTRPARRLEPTCLLGMGRIRYSTSVSG
jgi:integrase